MVPILRKPAGYFIELKVALMVTITADTIFF